MIDYIKGALTELQPAQAVVEASGVGYALSISLNTYTAIQGKENVKLYVHEAIVTGVATTHGRSMALLPSKSASSTACSSASAVSVQTRRG